jgi:hypothetical protein
MEVSGQLQAPAAFTSGKESPVPIGQEAEWASVTQWIGGWVDPRSCLDAGEKEKYLAPAENLTPAIQPIAHHYSDWVSHLPYTLRSMLYNLSY